VQKLMRHLGPKGRWGPFFISVLLGIAILCTEGTVASDGTRLVVPDSIRSVTDGNRPVPNTVSLTVLESQFSELLYDYDDFSDEVSVTIA